MSEIPKFLSWWPVLLAVLLFAAATGGQQVTIASQGKQVAENKTAVVSLKQGQARIDERTKNIQTQQQQAQETLNQILKELRTQ